MLDWFHVLCVMDGCFKPAACSFCFTPARHDIVQVSRRHTVTNVRVLVHNYILTSFQADSLCTTAAYNVTNSRLHYWNKVRVGTIHCTAAGKLQAV